MRKILLCIAAATALASSTAHAQLNLQMNTNDPLTGLSGEKWVALATRIVNPAPLIGKDSVYIVNATGEALLAVTCKGYQLVGSKPYITKNETTAAPSTLPAWTVTLVPTEGFNTYCPSGVEAQGNIASYHGNVNAGSFQNATFVIFLK